LPPSFNKQSDNTKKWLASIEKFFFLKTKKDIHASWLVRFLLEYIKVSKFLPKSTSKILIEAIYNEMPGVGITEFFESRLKVDPYFPLPEGKQHEI